MQSARPILFVVIALSITTGCVLKGKPKASAPAAVKPATPSPVAAAPPPPPLSIPQTNVQLPAPQPLEPSALATTPPPEEPVLPPMSQLPGPKTEPLKKPTNTPRPQENTSPPVAAPVEAPRELVRDAVPAEEAKRLRDEAIVFRREIDTLLSRASSPNATQSLMIENIRTMKKQSEEAEVAGDVRKANELAQRALTLAKALK